MRRLLNMNVRQWNVLMRDIKTYKKRFLKAIVDYAENSDKFNPHFYKKEIMDILNISEKNFNIIQKTLGDKYCHFVGPHNGEDRYCINYSECLSLQEHYDQECIAEKRHKQIVRLVVLVGILGAVIGVALNIWLAK